MAINIGDAVLYFTGDLTNLDAAFARVKAQAEAQLKPAGDVIDGLGKSFNATAQQALAAGTQISNSTQAPTARIKALQSEVVILRAQLQQTGSESATAFGAGNEAVAQLQARIAELEAEIATLNVQIAEMSAGFTEAGAAASFSMREATGTVGLLGEATGVQLPRHVRRFLAELPGVGSALEAAFSAAAVYFLIEALIQGAEKLTDFIAATFIFTDAMKKSDEITGKMNEELVKHSDAIKKLKDDYLLLGLSGIAKTSEQIALLNKQIEENTIGLSELQRKALGGDAQAQADFAIRTATAKDLQQQLTNLEKQGAIERQESRHKEALTAVEIDKERADSISRLKAEENRTLAADANAGIAVLTQIDVQYQQELYNNALIALQRKLALDKTDRTKDPGLIKQDNEKIEALQRDHATALIKIYADTIQGINSLSLGDSGRAGLGAQILGTDFQDRFAKAEEAAKELGITLSGTLAESVDQARLAVQNLEAAQLAGAATDRDLLRGKLALINAEIAFGIAAGKSTVALTHQRDEIRKALGLTAEYGRDAKQAAESIGSAITASAAAYGQGAVTITQALRQIAAATIEAIASIAEKKGVEQLAEAFGSWPDGVAMAHHFAAAALWFTLAGAVADAGGAVGGSRSNSGSSAGQSSSGGGTASAASQPEQIPVQTLNVQHFSGGGLLTKRTLAVVGDAAIGGGSQREAVLPLGDDSRALDEIAGRIYDRMHQGNSGQVVHNWNIDGVISGDNLHKVVKKITNSVNKGSVRLKSSDSFRNTRRG